MSSKKRPLRFTPKSAKLSASQYEVADVETESPAQPTMAYMNSSSIKSDAIAAKEVTPAMERAVGAPLIPLCIEPAVLPTTQPTTLPLGKETTSQSPLTENVMKMNGVDVHFIAGHKPFPAQLAIMSRVVTACNTGTNALLESPTGTGKTLALLCSALSYQREAKMRYYKAAAFRMHVAKHLSTVNASITSPILATLDAVKPPRVFFTSRTHTQLAQAIKEYRRCSQFHQWATFKSEPVEVTGLNLQVAAKLEEFRRKAETNAADKPAETTTTTSTMAATTPNIPPFDGVFKVPPVAMTILASRSHTCVNERIRRPGKRRDEGKGGEGRGGEGRGDSSSLPSSLLSVDDQCRELIKNSACGHDVGTTALGKSLPPVWDIEDLISMATGTGKGDIFFGRRKRGDGGGGGCPYFASRNAFETADLIFCPYNYILDPVLRNTMQIDLTDAILIIDEAHNVEDVAREAAGAELRREQLQDAVFSLARVIHAGIAPPIHTPLLHCLASMLRWMDRITTDLDVPPTEAEKSALRSITTSLTAGTATAAGGFVPDDADDAAARPRQFSNGKQSSGIKERVFSAQETALVIKEWEVTAEGVRQLFSFFETAMIMKNAAKVGEDQLSSASVMTIERVLAAYSFMAMLESGSFGISDRSFQPFRIAVSAGSQWDGKHKNLVKRLCIWCLSPLLAFKEIAASARTVVLTSGTLSPLSSFASELGAPFPIRLEAGHVINVTKQLWIGVVDAAPSPADLQLTPHASGYCVDVAAHLRTQIHSLSGVYQNAQTDTYLDAVGASLLVFATTVRGGVLVFFPSYRLLERVQERWRSVQTTVMEGAEATTCSVWDALCRIKRVFAESRDAGADFPAMIAQYRAANEEWLARATKQATGTEQENVMSTVLQSSIGKLDTDGPVPTLDANLLLGLCPTADNTPSFAKRSRPRLELSDEAVYPSEHTGAMLLGVCRGKASEGIDFSDHQARAVIIVGIPYANVSESQVALKRSFQDERCKAHTSTLSDAQPSEAPISGSQWYKQQAFRALNQSLGRCIRHKNDYGAVVLLDPRFNGEEEISSLSKWARAHVHRHAPLFTAAGALGSFFEELDANPPAGTILPVKVHSSQLTATPSLKIASPEPMCNTAGHLQPVGISSSFFAASRITPLTPASEAPAKGGPVASAFEAAAENTQEKKPSAFILQSDALSHPQDDLHAVRFHRHPAAAGAAVRRTTSLTSLFYDEDA